MKILRVVLIPPNGQLKKHDFSFQRIEKWLSKFDNIETTLLHIKPLNFTPDISIFKSVIEVKNEEELFDILNRLDFSFIFHRSWMGSYEFAARIIKEFNKVIINIKDWNFAEKEVYESIFPNNKDHESIDFIFKNCSTILSHFTKEQYLPWAKEYNTNESKFIFFPEFCNENNFNKRKPIKYKNIHLVYAGAIPPTSFPDEYFPGKSHLRSIKSLSKQKINIDFVLPPHVYDTFFNPKGDFLDFILESKLNKRFNIVKGKELNSEILNKYHFGFFELEASGRNHNLYKYAITSKFAFYLEAGIPILINEKFYSMSSIVKKHKLGIIFKNSDLKDLNKKINISQNEYNLFCKNINNFRKKFTYKVNVSDIRKIFNDEIS